MYQVKEWNSDKVLIAKLIHKGMYKSARDFVHDIHMLRTEMSGVTCYCLGMLFVLEILSAEKGDSLGQR